MAADCPERPESIGADFRLLRVLSKHPPPSRDMSGDCPPPCLAQACRRRTPWTHRRAFAAQSSCWDGPADIKGWMGRKESNPCKSRGRDSARDQGKPRFTGQARLDLILYLL